MLTKLLNPLNEFTKLVNLPEKHNDRISSISRTNIFIIDIFSSSSLLFRIICHTLINKSQNVHPTNECIASFLHNSFKNTVNPGIVIYCENSSIANSISKSVLISNNRSIDFCTSSVIL